MPNQEGKPSRTSLKAYYVSIVLIIFMGIYALLASDLPWLGAIVCGVGVLWLFQAWRFGRR